ncbi:hypothetical protein OMK64_19080, partial [Cellulomonas fimi]|nr:hypothetical protein [Cellulomonas fimi]
NLTITPFAGENRWAVSQAAPMRRVHVAGDLAVFPSSYGWASGRRGAGGRAALAHRSAPGTGHGRRWSAVSAAPRCGL